MNNNNKFISTVDNRIMSNFLFDGYLTTGLLLSVIALIIKHFLFDGYLTEVGNNPKILKIIV